MNEVNGWQVRQGRDTIYGAEVLAEAVGPSGQRATLDNKGDVILFINDVERGNSIKGQLPVPIVRSVPWDVLSAMRLEADKPRKGKK